MYQPEVHQFLQKKSSFVSVVPILNNKTLFVNSDVSCLSVIFCEIFYIGHNFKRVILYSTE